MKDVIILAYCSLVGWRCGAVSSKSQLDVLVSMTIPFDWCVTLCTTVRENHGGGGTRCFFILWVTLYIIRLLRGSMEVVVVVLLSESAYFSWRRVFFVETHMGKSSQ